VERYSRLQTLIAYWGFALYWGNVVSQNAKAHIVGHVKCAPPACDWRAAAHTSHCMQGRHPSTAHARRHVLQVGYCGLKHTTLGHPSSPFTSNQQAHL
jgi:hypothetical protein